MLIGEVSRRSGVSVRMLRHYDSLALVQPSDRTAGGYREYSAGDLRQILHVEMLRSLGLSLEQVRLALNDPAAAPADLVTELAEQTKARIAVEQELLGRLEHVGAGDPQEWTDVLHTIALLRAVAAGEPHRRQRGVLAAATEAPSASGVLAEAVLAEEELNVAGTLRWALARTEDGGLAELATGMASDQREVRLRAVQALAEIPAEAATGLLEAALADSHAPVRSRAALALGGRGVHSAFPALLEMIVAGPGDVDAAEALGGLAADEGLRAEILTDITSRLGDGATTAEARSRLTQALAEIPGPMAEELIADLARDAQPDVARTATYLLGLR